MTTAGGANPYAPSDASNEPTRIAWDVLPNEQEVISRHHSRGGDVCAFTLTHDYLYFSHEGRREAHRFDQATLLPIFNVLMVTSKRVVVELKLAQGIRLDCPREVLSDVCNWYGSDVPKLVATMLRRRWRGTFGLGLFLAAVPLLLGGSWYAVGEGAILVAAALMARLRPSRWAWLLEAAGYLAIAAGLGWSVVQQELSPWLALLAALILMGVVRAGRLFLFFNDLQKKMRAATR